METLLVYRICGRQEAQLQQIGEQYRLGHPPVVRSTQPGLHATLVPEYWRRILNRQMAAQGLGFRYTHTLLEKSILRAWLIERSRAAWLKASPAVKHMLGDDSPKT